MPMIIIISAIMLMFIGPSLAIGKVPKSSDWLGGQERQSGQGHLSGRLSASAKEVVRMRVP